MTDVTCEINVIANCFVEIYTVNVVEKNPVPKSQTNPLFIGTKEAPSDNVQNICIKCLRFTHSQFVSNV